MTKDKKNMKKDHEKAIKNSADTVGGGCGIPDHNKTPLVPEALLAQGPDIVDHYEDQEVLRAIIAGMSKITQDQTKQHEEQNKYIKKRHAEHEKNTTTTVNSFRDFVGKEVSNAKQEILEKVDTKLSIEIGKVDKRIDKVDTRMDRIEIRMDKFDSRMDKLDSRMDKLDSKIDRVDARIDKLDSKIDKVDAKIDTIGRTIWKVGATLMGFTIAVISAVIGGIALYQNYIAL